VQSDDRESELSEENKRLVRTLTGEKARADDLMQRLTDLQYKLRELTESLAEFRPRSSDVAA
jgi:hypothetical protein